MRISDFLILHLFILLLLLNLTKFLLGYWPVFFCIGIILFVLYCMSKLCENSLATDLSYFFGRSIGSYHRNHNLLDEWLICNHSSIENDEQIVCLQCHEQHCDQHDRQLAILLQPWKHLQIDAEINEKLEDFLQTLLDHHTRSWLSDISRDKNLMLFKFKELIRQILAAFVLRCYQKINLKRFILQQLPTHFLQHLEVYVHGKRHARSASFVEEAVLRQYGNRIHPALLRSDFELKYYKTMADLLLISSLPPKILECDVTRSFLNELVSSALISPLIDMLTDPNKLNIILIYFLNEIDDNRFVSIERNDSGCLASPKSFSLFLKNFPSLNSIIELESRLSTGLNHFGIEMKRILGEENLLFLFAKFAKEELILNHLQFQMHMNSFMDRIMDPNLSQSQLKDLHGRLKQIYSFYFDRKSKDCIEFDEKICNDFESFIIGHYGDVGSIRNCKSLYEAYEYVDRILNFYSKKFFQTAPYLSLICGERNSEALDDQIDRDDRKNSIDHLVDRTNSFQSDLLDQSSSIQLDHTNRSLNNLLECTDDFDSEHNHLDDTVDDESFLDLSDWKISIPFVSARIDENIRQENFYFEIHVHKSTNENMVIERKFQEFYILESKLREFYGDDLIKTSLPVRKSFIRITKQLLDGQREEFEQFLQNLLSNCSMNHSKLFFNFLNNSATDFCSANFNLTKMIRNVPAKFSKEKGQHLDPFFRNFIITSEKDIPFPTLLSSSSSSSSSTSSSISFSKEKIEAKRRKRENHRIEMDLGSIAYFSSNPNANERRKHRGQYTYLYDLILIVLIRFYGLSRKWQQFFILLRSILRRIFQNLCDSYLERKLREIFQKRNVVKMIDYLKSSIIGSSNVSTSCDFNLFDSNKSNNYREKSQGTKSLTKTQRSEIVLRLLKEILPKSFLECFVDYNKHEDIVFLLFSSLQCRLLNKQLLFLLMDLLLSDLFPQTLIETIEHKR